MLLCLEDTCGVSSCEQSFHANDPGRTAAPGIAGASRPAADLGSALLKTLQHLRGLPSSVLPKIIQLMAEPVGFWRETNPPQRLNPWLDDFTYSGPGEFWKS